LKNLEKGDFTRSPVIKKKKVNTHTTLNNKGFVIPVQNIQTSDNFQKRRMTANTALHARNDGSRDSSVIPLNHTLYSSKQSQDNLVSINFNNYDLGPPMKSKQSSQLLRLRPATNYRNQRNIVSHT
jgi:hypothetical protein